MYETITLNVLIYFKVGYRVRMRPRIFPRKKSYTTVGNKHKLRNKKHMKLSQRRLIVFVEKFIFRSVAFKKLVWCCAGG